MKAAIFRGPHHVELGERPDPKIENPNDAVVRVVMSCVCGSDLWYYRGINEHKIGSIGHEFIGVIEDTGPAVKGLAKGDFVIAPFKFSDGVCANCRNGFPTECVNGNPFGNGDIDGGQGQFVRVPYAGTTLVKVPEGEYSEDMLASFLTLSDVMCTGYHAVVSAGVGEGATVAVVGDGAVGLSAIIGARLKKARRIIALSRHPKRQNLAKEFGASEIIAERGDEAVIAVRKLTDGIGVDAALECVGSDQSIATCTGIVRAGGMVGAVGVPNYEHFEYKDLFWKNAGIRGGIAPARRYIPELLQAVLNGHINPGRVFDFKTDLEHVAEAYAAMDERRATKSLLYVSS